MEGTERPPPVIVEGDWNPAQTKTMKNKLQLYFQSKKKSSGGDCRVEAEDGAPRAAVYFRSEEGESLFPPLLEFVSGNQSLIGYIKVSNKVRLL